ncbi:MAG: GNAT family N-acetyltransferase [Thermoanaerobaculia bacterium]|nr:GNAT family N-acetyltransferase [Thermoanaerobaculia bacterium]
MAETTRSAIRAAAETDVPLILAFIRELAAYEELEHEVVATEEDLRRTLFGDRPGAEVLLLEEWSRAGQGEETAEAAGFALFFHNFSTFLGRPGIYLEDLFVRPQHRGKGYGRSLLQHLALLALERGCGRLEWWVLDWNEPAIGFYRKLGAEAMDEWTVFRLSGSELERLARPGA